MVMPTFFIRQQIDASINDLMHEMSKQLVEIIKPMVRNKMQLVQQQHKEMSHVQGHQVEAMHAIMPEIVNETAAYTGGIKVLNLAQCR